MARWFCQMLIRFNPHAYEPGLIASLLWDAPEPVDEFWLDVKVGLARQCWPWIGKYTSSAGYGLFRTDGGWLGFAHRESFRRCRGPIVDGLWVLHRCDNPPCVNPSHLFLGTPTDNVRDSMAKGRRPTSLDSGSTSTETSKNQRRRRLENGLCLTCGIPVENQKRCAPCVEKKRAYDAARYPIKEQRRKDRAKS